MLHDDVIIEQIIQTLEDTGYKLVSFERDHSTFGNIVTIIQSAKEKFTFSTDRGDIWCNDRLCIHSGYHIAGQDDEPIFLLKAIRDTIKPNPNIKISGDIPHGVAIHIRLGNEVRVINTDTKEIGFTVDKPGRYWIEFEEEATSPEEPIDNPGAFLIWKFIRGILCAFLLTSEWDKRIKAYIIKARYEIELIDKLELSFMYAPSEYMEEQEGWAYPSLILTTVLKSESEYGINPYDFTKNLNEYASGATMLCGAANVFFGFITVKALLAGNTAAALTFGSLVIGISVLAVLAIKSQRKKCKKLYETCAKKISG